MVLNDEYTVKGAYKLLSQREGSVLGCLQNLDIIWYNSVMMKVSMFA